MNEHKADVLKTICVVLGFFALCAAVRECQSISAKCVIECVKAGQPARDCNYACP